MSSEAARKAFPETPRDWNNPDPAGAAASRLRAQHLQHAYDRGAREKAAEAWDEGALWAVAEVLGDRTPREFLVPGDNPYREADS